MPGARKKFLSALMMRGWPYLLTALLVFTFGITVGALSVERLDSKQSEEVSRYLQGFVRDLDEFNIDHQRVARNSLLNGAVMVGAIYILGLTVIGMPVTLAILFARGFVLGFAVGFLVRDLAAGGILMALVSVVPHNLLYIPALLVGVASSLAFGMLLLKRNFNTRLPVLPNYVMYTTIMLVVLVVTLGAGMVESYVSPWLTKMAAEALQSGLATPTGS